MYSFLLTLTKTNTKLELTRDKNIVLSKTWIESRDMGRQLFVAIQALLSETGLKPDMIQGFEVKTDVSDNFTSVKIAQTVQKTFLFANAGKKLEVISSSL